MPSSIRAARARRLAAAVACLVLLTPFAVAFTPRQTPARFDPRTIQPPDAVVGLAAVPVASLSPSDPLRAGWDRLALDTEGGWTAWIDERSGLPTLAIGRGVEWFPVTGGGQPTGEPPGLEQLEALARAFMAQHPAALGRFGGQLQLDRAASGPAGDRVFLVTFGQAVDGVPVAGARYDFQVVAGRLVAVGASRWSDVRTETVPRLTRDAARAALDAHLGIQSPNEVLELEDGLLHLLPIAAGGDRAQAWGGPRGAGYTHRLTWRFVFAVPDEPATWIAEVDAATGEVVALYDDTRYARVKGGIFPLSNDGIGPEGTEQPGFPMPFADTGASQSSNDQGVFNCSSGTIPSTLAGPYIRVSDKCGTVSASATCPRDIDFGDGPGTDCAVPPGGSPGNTHAARSSFYHLNRVMEKGRSWLPSNGWLASQVVDNVNINNTCNAFWNGSVNFYRSGGGCRNTGELQGVFVHEWGHGLDANDGGGYDNPSEAYADIVAFLEARESCVGRGFFIGGNCSGYGDPCLDCSGIRDQDWGKHQRQLPATPTNFLQTNCGGGDGPCGREGHCEAYVSAEAVWDLAARDLPAAGLDPASAWQLTEKLFYLSRLGSGGNAYNCALPSSDGCGTGSWYHKFRLQDDNDGNLANGTPHAGAIYAAFARHGIACGAASDPSNQNSSTCPPLARPVLSADPSGTDVRLSWNLVTGTARYRILRNDLGCARGQTIIADVASPTTTYADTAVAAGRTLYYRVLAQSSNSACESPVSECVAVTTAAPAGRVELDRSSYACGVPVRVTVLDGNAGASVSVRIWSGTEPDPEVLTLAQTEPGSGRYAGSIATTAGPAAHGDGLLSIATGDAITAEYTDADDGEGGTGIARRATAVGDCAPPSIGGVAATGISDREATIVWQTNESSDGVVTWGPRVPPQATATGAPLTTAHSVTLSGLVPCTVYHYSVRSADPAGNVAVDDAAGLYHRFLTLGNFGGGLETCRTGTVTIDQPSLRCQATLSFAVVDIDLNRDPAAVETALVQVGSTTEGIPETVLVTEDGADSPRFAGAIVLSPGAPIPDGRLQAANGDVLTVSYADADDGHGGTGWRTATARADCRGPAISGLVVDMLTNARARVRFTTDEPGDTVVRWGATPALEQVASSSIPSTSHSTTLNQFDSCQPVYLRVESTDAAGNVAVADAGGAPHAFRTWTIPGLYWRETFEGASPGWSLQGEWEIGAPQGKGGASFGFPDPAAPYNNAKILGHDLSGRGAAPGDYEAGSNEKAASPTLNATTWRRTELIVHRKLNAGLGDDASIYLCAGSCGAVFRTALQAFSDPDYTVQRYDVSADVDAKSSVRLEFRQNSILGTGSGWNVDDVIFKDAATPDYAACGGCGQAPSFAGAASARDDDACAASGVTISWEPAAAWGTGASGSYAVYRGTSTGFPADAAHRIASGLTALSYADASPPAGALYYLVRAENDETCGGGPANGGTTDTNAIYAPVEQTISRPLPAAVTSLAATLANHAHVRLVWPAASGSTSYRVYRSATPGPGGFTLLATTSGLIYEDLDQQRDATTWFYLVRGVNPCGQEGP